MVSITRGETAGGRGRRKPVRTGSRSCRGYQLSQLTDEDLEAIYTYLMSRTPVRNSVEKRTYAMR